MTYLVKMGDDDYLDSIGGATQPPPRWGAPEDATRYVDSHAAGLAAAVYGGRVVRRTRVSFKARAERAQADVARLREAIEGVRGCKTFCCYSCRAIIRNALASTSPQSTRKTP